MNANLSDVLAVGLLAIIVGSSALVMLVRVDLVPSNRLAGSLEGGGRWFLAAALGVGIIAFAI
ncbi:MAG TPA: hypothetical protein VEB64_07730, partial [Azospirillaceae bacterium]|nr:hypothetical protein [Azospirillaceae bacterium]